jgi:ribosomal protein S18 acetylase RimI-like enzyme
LNTYPNEELGITVEDIEYHLDGRLSPEGIQKFKDRVESYESFEDKEDFTAKVGNKVVGACRISILEDRNILDALYVLPDFQGKGVGKMLWEQALKTFDPENDIIVTVASYNSKAIDFYKSLGFVECEDKPGESGVALQNGKFIPSIELKIPKSLHR